MNHTVAASLSRSLQQCRAGLVSALLFLGGAMLGSSAAWADNGAAANTAANTLSPPAPAAHAAANTAAAAAQSAGAALPSSGGSVFTMLLGLTVVLAVLAAVAWLFKRFGLNQGLAGNAAAKVVGGVSVGTRERVMVIEVGEQWIVVGVAPGRVNALATMPRQTLTAAQAGATGNAPAFATWLKHTMDKRNGAAGNGERPGQDGSTS